MIGKFLAVAIPALISSFGSFCQSGFSMERYLATALVDQSLEQYHAQLNFLNDRRFTKPLIDKVELRLGSQNAGISLNEYRLRISPSNPAEVRANKLFYQKQLNSVNSAYRVALNEALKNRYLLLIDHYYFHSRLEVLAAWQTDAARLIGFVSNGATENIDLGDVIDFESDMSDALTKINELSMWIDEIEYFIKLDLPGLQDVQWTGEELISVDAIRRYVDETDADEVETNIYVKEAREELTLEEQMYKVNAAESWNDLGFIEGEYDSERGNEPREHFGFRVGVVLPVFNSDKADLDRDRFDLLEEASEVNAVKELVKRQRRRLLIKLQNLFERHKLLQERKTNAKHIKPVVPVDKPVEVLHLLDHKSYLTELDEKELETRRDIYETFIEFLDIAGRLSGEPLINYLSPGFEAIE